MKGGSRLMTLQLPAMAPSEVQQAEMLIRQSLACATIYNVWNTSNYCE